MKKSIEITPNSMMRIRGNKLIVKENNIETESDLEDIKDVHCRGRKTIPAYILYTFLHNEIPVYYYEGRGRFLGGSTPLPKQSHSACLVMKQTQHRQDPFKRLVLIREIERGIKHNILWLLKKYNNIGFRIGNYIEIIDSIIFSDVEKPSQLKSREGRIWHNFYRAFDKIVPGWGFERRTRRPPKDPISAMMSYGNQILYGKIHSLISITSLHQGIGYIHESSDNKRSLAFDIVDLFKTVIVYPIIIRLIHWNLIKKSHFEQKGEEVKLNEAGKRILTKELQKKFNEKIKNPLTSKKYTLLKYIQQEHYKLINHLKGKKNILVSELGGKGELIFIASL